jgi:hypothetical protein
MHWMRIKRGLSILAGGSALLLAAACGGGDKSPTGPTDPGGQAPDNPNTVEFRLAALGRVGLPADLEIEDCKLTRFYSGKIEINPRPELELVSSGTIRHIRRLQQHEASLQERATSASPFRPS